ncbi:serine/arginine-rich splicing factor 11 isoform X2 [Pteropus alecto]|uniref:Serine/arginine-rich splicing factor 11 isoform X2 n=1 Tax=Pteropus vampyrus TaxID=132908 RepID=A0A6P6CRY9_PTEVA|nr:serine/arginine-rich splicing factor 11 isoform X2 [Pteropus vampyrus]XP_024907656.1 serine/arginine-rich splicing factor 11 isoform X2 [Pteropus alecto]XP_039694500.1 serine/arginine-rich splicing factor 11 isoform X2 [Pteropus giganteus]
MSNTTVVPSTAGPGPSGGPGGGGGGGGGGGTEVIQVTNVSPSASSEQMRTLFGFLGKIDELRLFPPDDSPLPVSSRVCFVKFHDPDSAVVAQHLTNTVFVDRALIVVPYAEGVIPDETKALSLLAPANAVAGLLPGGGLLPTPNPLTQIGAVPLAALGAPTLDPALAALGLPGANLNSQSLAADQLLKLMSTVDPKLNHVAAGLVSPSLKSDTSSKEIEEAMKRVREAQSLISAAIEPDKKEEKRRHSRSRSRSRRRRTPSSSRHRRSRSRSRRRSHSKSRSRRRSKSPRRRRSHSRERGRRSRSTSKTRDKKKEDKEKKRSKTPPKSYSTARRSRSASSCAIICQEAWKYNRERRRRRSRSGTRSPKKPRSPKRKLSRSPSPRRTFYCHPRHKKEKKKDKDKERGRDERERSTSKKKKSKDKEKDRERKSESDKDVKVTRDYDEEEQGYDSEKEKKEEKKPTEPGSPKTKECSVEKGTSDSLRESKVNGDDHHEEDMDMSD